MIVALLAVACVASSPTPTFRCDCEGVGVAGFRVYWRHADTPAGRFDGSFDLPSTVIRDEDTGEACLWAPGWQLDYPIQRQIPVEGVEVVAVGRSYDFENVEGPPSAEMIVCMPRVWRRGERYE